MIMKVIRLSRVSWLFFFLLVMSVGVHLIISQELQYDILVDGDFSAHRDASWSADGTRFTFSSTSGLGTSLQDGFDGVEFSQPAWRQYNIETRELTSYTVWPLQPVLTAVQAATWQPKDFVYTSPNEDLALFNRLGTGLFAIASFPTNTYGETNQIGDLGTYSPGPFVQSWDSAGRAVTAQNVSLGGIGVIFYVAIPESNVLDSTIYEFGTTLSTSNYLVFSLEGDRLYDLAPSGRLVLLSGRNTALLPDETPVYRAPATLIVWDPVNDTIRDVPLTNTSLPFDIAATAFSFFDETKIWIVHRLHGLVEVDIITRETRILRSELANVSAAYFSPNAQWLAVFEEGQLAFVNMETLISEPPVFIATPTLTPTASATSTPISTMTAMVTITPMLTSTFTSVPTSTFTPTATFTFIPTPPITCTVTAANPSALINAINAANNNGASADTICLEEGTYTFASASNSIALPSITTPITLVGNGAIIERGSGAPNFRLFNITSSGALILEDLTLRNGNASGSNGGAILNAGSLTLDGVTLANNSARFGGGIHSSGSLVIRGSTLVTNSAVENGGAVYVNSGTLTLSDTTLEENSARYGSGVYLNNGTADLTGVTARANHATEQGAGVYQRTGTLTISGGLFENNTARFGNGVYVDAGTAAISGVTMRENVAVEEGAGIYNRTGSVSVADSVFEGNQARYGAAISNRGTVSVAGSAFTGNSVQESGGAVYTTRSTSGNQVQQSCFEGNTARFGGSVFSSASRYDARDSWWGEVTGPTSAMVNGNVLTEPFLTDGCPQ